MSSFLLRRATVASAGAARAFSTTSPRSVARITIIGHLADSPEGMTAGSGESLKEYVRYTVASNSGPKDARQTSWFRVTGFVDGPRRDFIMGLPKGYVICVLLLFCARNDDSSIYSERTLLTLNLITSSMVYVEGDASINTYTDSNGQNRQGLSIIQRKPSSSPRFTKIYNLSSLLTQW